MSTIFADKFKNTSGGNPVQINQLRGIDTAGSIAVQGEGTATTNLQQGLAKAWINFVGAGTSINDSFGMSSLADDGTGIYTITMSSVMSNANYSITIGIKELGGGNNHAGVVKGDVTVTTTVFAMRTYSSGTPQDVTFVYDTVHGDLA